MFYFSGMGPGSKGNLATVNIEAKNSDVKELLKMAYPGPNARWGPKEWAWIGLRKVGVNTSLQNSTSSGNANSLLLLLKIMTHFY